MATWIVGDVHGYFGALKRLLKAIDYTPSDQIIFVGDLVNGGGKSRKVVRWCADHNAIVTLGNHDLHMLAVWSGARERRRRDDFHDLLDAPDAPELIDWLGGCPLTYRLPEFNACVVHAGLPPTWTVDDAERIGAEVEHALDDFDARPFFADMYGDTPRKWKEEREGAGRYRYAINALTRMRVLDEKQRLDLQYSGSYDGIPRKSCAWFDAPERAHEDTTIIFGHWSALGANKWPCNVISLDAGVRWGRELAALRMEDGAIVRVPAKKPR